MAAITYDSPAVLADFARRRTITYPLLSDEGSRVIRAFGILNTNIPADSPAHGVPFPGTYLLDARGRVKSKYFEEDYRERYSAASILMREFKEDGGATGTEIQAKHLALRLSASNPGVYVGSRITLVMDLILPPKMHVYAPGVTGYIPIAWEMPESKGWLALPPAYPSARTLHLRAIGEKVPVYEGRVRLTRDLVAGQAGELKQVTQPDGTIAVEGSFRYQACDDKVCYVPETVPLRWSFPVAPLDSQRVPAELRKGFQ